jgi:hypothetical protein
MKNRILIMGAVLVPFMFASYKKDDKSGSSTTTTTTTSTTAPAAGPNTLIFEGVQVPNITGNCEYSGALTVTGDVTLSDGTNYFVSADFSVEQPSGTFTTVRLPSDPISATQCHLQVTRTKGSYVLSMLAPTGATVKVVKNGMKYTISFGTIKFDVVQGANGTRSISCTSYGC